MKCRIWTLTSRGGGHSDMLHFLPFRCYRADRSREVEPKRRSSSASEQEAEPAEVKHLSVQEHLTSTDQGLIFIFLLRVKAFSSILASCGTHTDTHTLASGSGVVFQEPSPFLHRSSWLRVIFTTATRAECQHICMKKGRRVAHEWERQRGSITSLLTTCSVCSASASVLLQQAAAAARQLSPRGAEAEFFKRAKFFFSLLLL